MERDKKEHPSWGRIVVTQPTGGNKRLFGSSAVHNSTIRIEIEHASLIRDLSTDWIHGASKPAIISLEMTHAQWATMVSSQGIGMGTPCTIRYLNGEKVEEAEYEEDRHEIFFRELMKSLDSLSPEHKGRMQELLEIVDGLKLSQKSKTELLSAIRSLAAIMTSQVPFVAEMFQEFMEKEAQSRKIETEAHAIQVLVNMGLDKLAEQQVLTSEKNIKEIEEK